MYAIKSLIVALLFSSVAMAQVNTYVVKPGKPNLVKFTSKAPMETIVGTTDQISGSIVCDPTNLIENVSVVMEVKMATLDTDNSTRNGHMRDNHLHTDQYPLSRFELSNLTDLAQPNLTNGVPVRFKAMGNFTLHGKTNPITPEIEATWNSGSQVIEITATFSVKLPDYEIPRPQFLVMRLDEIQQIEVRFQAVLVQ